jgi:hypothetical protein
MDSKIRIIICGWWFDEFDDKTNQTDFIDALNQLQELNPTIEIFWSCHKEPIPSVKENFKWKLYENVGLEWGAYQKAILDIQPSDEDYIFCIQDDMVITDWSFLSVCIKHLQDDSVKVIGNGFNYPYFLTPEEEARLSFWLKTNDKWVDYVRSENKHLFQEPINCLSIRGSFLATKYKHLKSIGGFEYINLPLSKGVKEDGTEFLLVDPFGNTALYLNAYKFTKYFGVHSMKWLSNNYRKSKWMVECGRGMAYLPQDDETPPFNVPQEFLID